MSTESARFGKYRLLRRIGAGGMGEVHLAKLFGPSGFEKLVVIKRLLQNRREEQRFVDMFFSEARVTAQLNHSNIVQIYEVDTFENIPYIAMEYVRGKSLRHILDASRRRGGPKNTPNRRLPCLPAHYIAQIFVELCHGLAFAHDARHMSGATLGLIHRDINPHNVLLTYQGEVKLIDFGIAKSELTLDKTQAGTIKGTVIYMSPEQSAGRKLDRRSDMFSVGICLYEMLAGNNPFQKDNMAASLESIRQAKVPPLDLYNAEIAPFAPIVYRALAKEPEARFDDCEQMSQALAELLQSGLVAKPDVSLADFLQRLFVDAIEEEDRLLSQTEVVESADLAAFLAQRQPQEIQGAKTVALSANPLISMQSDVHTVADTPYGKPLSDELSGLGAPLRLPGIEHVDPRPTKNLGPTTEQSSLAPILDPTLEVSTHQAATVGHLDLGSLGGASAAQVRTSAKARFKQAYDTDAADGHEQWSAPKATLQTLGEAPDGPAPAELSKPSIAGWRRLRLLRRPKAFWGSLTAGERLASGVFGSVVLLAWLCVGYAYSTASMPPSTVLAPTPPAAPQAEDTLQSANPEPTAPAARVGEPQMYNEELNIDAMADASVAQSAQAPAGLEHRQMAHHAYAPHRRAPPKATAEAARASLLVGMEPAVALLKDGVAQQRTIKLHNQPGTLQFAPVVQSDGQSTFDIKVHYRMTQKGMLYSIESEPWANVTGAGGLSLGRTPIDDMLGSTTTVFEFHNPHVTTSQRISLHVSVD